MQAIKTTTITKAGIQFVQAKCDVRKITITWNYSKNQDWNHAQAAQELADLLKWGGILNGGAIGNEYFWTFLNSGMEVHCGTLNAPQLKGGPLNQSNNTCVLR